MQSILQQEDDHSKDEAGDYHTSYFEPISLDEASQLPPINDIQRKGDYRGNRLAPPAQLYHNDTLENTGYTANWPLIGPRNTFGWEVIQ